MSKLVSFSHALEAVKYGERIARDGWDGRGMFLFLVDRVPAPIRLPEKVGSFRPGEISPNVVQNYFLAPFIAMKTADEKLVPWLASHTDVLADDWRVL